MKRVYHDNCPHCGTHSTLTLVGHESEFAEMDQAHSEGLAVVKFFCPNHGAWFRSTTDQLAKAA